MDNILQLNEFFIEGGNQEKSHVLLHITEPSTPEEQAKGYFFAICEVDNANHQYILRLQSIIDEIERQYYEYGKSDDKHPLEIVLEKINQENFTLIKEKDIQLNCVVGVISEQEVVFSSHGHPQIILFYKNREDIYHKMDLAENGEETPDKQLFSQIVQGKISPHDFLFLSSPGVVDYFNHDRLQKIITSRPTKQSAEHLEHVLSGLRNDFSYGGLIIHLENNPENLIEKKQRPSKNNGSARSLDHLYVTEQDTASTLAPSMLNKFNKKIQSIVRQTPHLIDQIEVNEQKNPTKTMSAQIASAHLRPHRPLLGSSNKGVDYRHLLASSLRVLWQFGKYLGQALIWLFTLIWQIILVLTKFISSIFFIITDFRGQRRLILASWGQNWKNYKEHFKNLPLPTKILFLTSVILVLIFASSVWYISAQKEKNARATQFNEQIKTFKEKKDSAESYLIYNDETKAAGEIQEAKKILENADCASVAHAKECEEYKNQIEVLALRVRKEKEANPELIYDWSNVGISLTGLAKINNKIIAYSSSNSDLFIYDLLTKNPSQIKTGDYTGFTASAVPKENDYALFVYDKNKLLQYNPEDDTAKSIDIAYPLDNVNLSGLVVYNRKLYDLDKNSGQIYKHDNIKSGFAEGKIWIKDGSKLSGPRSITIDGDVFVADDQGIVIKFNAGKKQEFGVLNIDPPLQNIDSIWTYNDLQYVYILDSSQKRLLVLNKDGKLEKQLTSKSLIAPLASVVEESARAAYIIDQNKLYKIGL